MTVMNVAADGSLNISLGIWLVRAEGEALALALQARQFFQWFL